MRKGATSIFFLIIYVYLNCYSQTKAQGFCWAKRTGASSWEQAKAIAVDNSGNVYTACEYQGTVDFDPGPGVYNQTSNGNKDFCIQKLNSSGNFEWAKSIGGPGLDSANELVADASGNTYCIGSFAGTVDFDPGPGIYNLVAASYDIYVVKLNSLGNLVWAIDFGTSGVNGGYSICLDAFGNILVSGSFVATVDFDPGAGVLNLTSNGQTEIFVVKLDPSANLIWAKQIGGVHHDSGSAVACEASGNVCVAGTYAGTVDFDPGSGVFNMSSISNTSDIFVSKLDASGNFIWAKTLGGGSSFETATSLAVNSSGNIYVTGAFLNSIDFDPGPGIVILSSINSSGDGFLLKLDASGNYLSANQIGGIGDDIGEKVVLGNSGDIYLVGRYHNTIDFDPGPAIYNLSTHGLEEIFILKLNSSGVFDWARSIGGPNDEGGLSIAVDNLNYVYTTGYFMTTVDFNPGGGIFNMTSAASTDIFTLKMSECNSSSSFLTVSNCNTYTSPSGMHTWTISGTYSDTLTNATGCDSIITINLTINSVPVQPGTISGNTVLCQGDTNIFSISAVPGATSYTWALPNGWMGSSTTSSISTISGTSGGSITVIANNACGSSSAQTLNVTVNSVPQLPVFISGNSLFCPGDNITYVVNNNPSATSYSWTMPVGWAGSSGSNTINVTTGANSGAITVTANNACGSSASQSFNVSLGSAPLVPVFTAGDTVFCPGSSLSYSVNNDTLANSYNWLLPAGWSGNSSTNLINVTPGANAGIISVSAVNGCGSSSSASLSLSFGIPPFSAFSFSGTNGTISFSDFSINSPVSWFWDFGDGNTSTLQNPTHSYLVNGQYTTCLIASNNCGSDTSCKLVDVIIINNDIAKESSFEIYPNPSTGTFILEGNRVDNEPLSLYMLDLSGRVLWSSIIFPNNGNVTTLVTQTNFADGFYFLEIWQGNRKIIKPIVIRE